MSRTHVNNIFSRDTSQSLGGARSEGDGVLDVLRARSDTAIAEDWPYPKGFLRYFRPAALLLVGVDKLHLPRRALRIRNIAKNAA